MMSAFGASAPVTRLAQRHLDEDRHAREWKEGDGGHEPPDLEPDDPIASTVSGDHSCDPQDEVASTPTGIASTNGWRMDGPPGDAERVQ